MATSVAKLPIFMSFPYFRIEYLLLFLTVASDLGSSLRILSTVTTMSVHDFRSDTVTLPTPQMMAAVAAARLGDSARGDDPTVLELEALGCELTGKEDTLFVPSGT